MGCRPTATPARVPTLFAANMLMVMSDGLLTRVSPMNLPGWLDRERLHHNRSEIENSDLPRKGGGR